MTSSFGETESIWINYRLAQTELDHFWEVLADYERVLLLAERYIDQAVKEQQSIQNELEEISSRSIHLQDVQAKLSMNFKDLRRLI